MSLFQRWGEFVSNGLRFGFRGGASFFKNGCKLVSEVGRVVFRDMTIYFQRFGELVQVVGRFCARGGMRCLYGLVESSEGVE